MSLIITRRVGDTFLIGEDIYITMMGISNKQIRVSTEVDKSVSIYREEVYLKLLAEEDPELSDYLILGSGLLHSRIRKLPNKICQDCGGYLIRIVTYDKPDILYCKHCKTKVFGKIIND